MAYPGGYSSDEDGLDGFLSDDLDDSESEIDGAQIEARLLEMRDVEPQITLEQKLNNLYYAIMNGNTNEVISLIENGVDVNCNVRDNWSPILLAASIGNPDIVRQLIRLGADINSSRDKYTVLMAACNCPEKTSPISKCLDVVTQLIEHGALVDAITPSRKTALMFAASNGRVEIIRKLMTHVNIHAEDNQGWNVLFWAVNDNKSEAVQFFLEEGLSPYKMDVRGKTPIDYATMYDFHDILNLFPVERDTKTLMQNTYYEIDTLFDTTILNERPQFYLDVCGLLYGMKCESLTEKFVNVNLLEFLCLDDKRLKALDINIPYQRHRILSGLHRFHKHLYKQRSIPIVPKDSTYSTLDVSNAIVCALRQIISMEAGLRYISTYDKEDEKENKLFPTDIVRQRISELRKTATSLHSLVEVWDDEHPPADLITKYRKRRFPLWSKLLGYFTILTVTVIIIKKT